jgi:tetratricopeptide (TPR) repeat protein
VPINRSSFRFICFIAVVMSAFVTQAQNAAAPQPAQVEGVVRDRAGKPAAEVTVIFEASNGQTAARALTRIDGTFALSALAAGRYTVKLEKSGSIEVVEDSLALAVAEKKHFEFVLGAPKHSTGNAASLTAVQLDERPNFTVAGVTDSTGSGGHGSEARMRTGEALARDTANLTESSARAISTPDAARSHASEVALRAALQKNPQSFDANRDLGRFYFDAQQYRAAIPLLDAAYRLNPSDRKNALDLALALKACGEFTQARDRLNELGNSQNLDQREQSTLHRLIGDLDEKLNDPLSAVREYQHAAELDPTEENYFAWGTELLIHRADAPAIEVFTTGSHLHADSARMLAGLGAALYSSGSADEAAERLCQAADLDPSQAAPYLFLGKLQEATSSSLPCVEPKLARFARDQPANPLANYYYGLALWKQNRGSQDAEALQRAEDLLRKGTELDPRLEVAFLALGNLYFSRGMLPAAIANYQKAIADNPAASEPHYRLGLAYRRGGEEDKAQNEFEQYKKLDRAEIAGIERQRREIRQFLFVLQEKPDIGEKSNSTPNSPN